jgi:hypothetical protein
MSETTAAATIDNPTPTVQAHIAVAVAEAKKSEVWARNLTVDSQDTLDTANAGLARIDGHIKALEAHRLENVGDLTKIVSDINAAYRPVKKQLESAKAATRAAMSKFVAAQKAEERRKQIEAEQAAAKEREKLRKKAQKAAEKGDHTKAAEIEQAADEVETEVIEPEVSAPTGMVTTERWVGKVVNVKEMCKAIADGVIPEDVIEVKQARLNELARALKKTATMPGLDFYAEVSVSGRKT